MPTLTAKIMGVAQQTNHLSQRRKMKRVCEKLSPIYGEPGLGNFREPLDEIAYIVLSARTTEQLYQRAHASLKKKFPTWPEVARANPTDLHGSISVAGFGLKRAQQLVEIYRRVFDDFGNEASSTLRKMDAAAVYNYLTQLPGIAAKSALCVMMWSLDHDVLPADTHVARIMSRLGIIPTGLRPEEAQRLAAPCAPRGISKRLHTVLVMHGRNVCKPQNPLCDSCVLARMCPSKG